MVTNLRQFILRCEDGKEDPYHIFEYECTEELRALIYSLGNPLSPEPFRSAMHAIGYVAY
jgi:hypothetical protein